MHTFFIAIGVCILFLMLLTLYRVIIGPTSIDRIMGTNVIGTKTAVLLIVIGAVFNRIDMFVDIALAYAMLNFIATLAAARYFKHHKNFTATGFGFRHKEQKSK